MKHVIDPSQKMNPGDHEVKIDFILIGYGMWSIKPKAFENPKEKEKRFKDFREHLPQVLAVGIFPLFNFWQFNRKILSLALGQNTSIGRGSLDANGKGGYSQI